LVFAKEDFEQGFDRSYTFPDITECDGSGWNRSGRLRLSYPGPLGSLHAEVRYETRRVDPTYHGDCLVKFGFEWAGDLEPHGDDPEGLYPAASFENTWTGSDPYVRAKVFGKPWCDDTSQIDPRMEIRLGLLYWDGQAGAFVRRAFLEFHGLDVPGDVFGRTESEPPETEVSVEPDASYDDWIPAGNVGQPETPAAWLQVKVKVHRKDDPDTLVPATLRFTLQRVSRERGVCLNWPPGDANSDPDLRLKFEDSQLGVPSDDGTSIQTNRPVKELVLIVDAYDFGAWGTLQVSGTDVNNRAVAVKVRGKQSNELYIPLDEDQNHVADAWKPDDATGKRSDEDDEHQEGNIHDGDGLTLYEEYRGFVEAGEPRKGDPAKKDFFIQNLIGAQAIPGIGLFQDATELVVHHRFTEQELDWERVINRYSSSGRKQHGVVLAMHQPGADPGYSEAIGGPGPPAKVSPILITSKKTPMDYEVAHELLHACNVAHHGETDKEVRWVAAIQQGVLTEKDCGSTKQITAFAESGEPLDWGRMRERGPLQVLMPAQHGQVSGEEECLMRYVYGGLIARIDSTDPKVRRLTRSGEIGTKLCRSGAGTGINATNIGWGNATNGRGNCFGQIHVNDAVPAEARTPLKQECN
jgi:hypothetical protein